VLSDPQRIRLVDLAESPEGFVALVRRLETGLPPRQQAAQARLRTEGWEAKARQFETWALAEQPG
jgi:hypothetical protein